MPNRNSYGSSHKGFVPRYGTRGTFVAPRAPHLFVQPVPLKEPGLLSGIGSTLASGLAFGAGSEVSHQAIRGIMGPSYQPVPILPATNQTATQYNQQLRTQQLPCSKQINDFAQCIERSQNDIGSCQEFSDLLMECRKNLNGNLQ